MKSIKIILVVVLSVVGLGVIADKLGTPVSSRAKKAQPGELIGGNGIGCAGCSRG